MNQDRSLTSALFRSAVTASLSSTKQRGSPPMDYRDCSPIVTLDDALGHDRIGGQLVDTGLTSDKAF